MFSIPWIIDLEVGQSPTQATLSEPTLTRVTLTPPVVASYLWSSASGPRPRVLTQPNSQGSFLLFREGERIRREPWEGGWVQRGCQVASV